MSADALAKELYLYLLAGECHTAELRRLGWFEFLRFDLPDTDDARVLAAVALHRLLIDDSGAQINHDGRIIYATLAFVIAKRGDPSRPTLVSRGLERVLAAAPVSETALVE
ncbi:MAG TPA: hypothetical protein VF541_06760, partial [Longimicrobium sp.]